MRPDELPEIDLIAEQSDDAGGNPGNSLLAAAGVIVAIAGLVAGVLMVATLGGSTPRADQEGAAVPDPAPELDQADPETSEREARRQAAQVARRVPAPLLAAELFRAAPSADGAPRPWLSGRPRACSTW